MIIIYNLETLSVKQGDYIVITYDKDKITPAKMQSVFESICQEFKDKNRVVAIPNSMEMTTYEKSRMIEFLRNLLNELEGNND